MPLLPAKFSDDNAADNPVEEWHSCWRQAVSTSTGETQTDDLEQQNQRTQYPKRNEVEVQTEDVADVGATPMVRTGFAKLRELDAFLEQCVPLLEEQLHRNLTTRAFDGHEVAWEEQHDQVTCLHSLRHQGALANLSPEACTAVAWNAPGTVVAAAYGALDRNDWQRCPSMLYVVALPPQSGSEEGGRGDRNPDCLTCLPSTRRTPPRGRLLQRRRSPLAIGEKGDRWWQVCPHQLHAPRAGAAAAMDKGAGRHGWRRQGRRRRLRPRFRLRRWQDAHGARATS